MYLLLLAMLADPHPALLKNEIFVPADYPKKVDPNVDGRVRFTLEIDPNGRPTNCKIESSSGSTRLDENTCRLAVRRARFDPARDADGNAIKGSWTSSIRWLPAAASDAAPFSRLTRISWRKPLAAVPCKPPPYKMTPRGTAIWRPRPVTRQQCRSKSITI